MNLNTASAVISFAKQLETDSERFYESLAVNNSNHKDVFLSLAKENIKFIRQFESAYYNVITDAIEGCFSFSLETDKHVIDTSVSNNSSFLDVLHKAINLEEKMIQFYVDAAEQSKTLMADVPRAFTLIAKKRSNRIQILQSLH